MSLEALAAAARIALAAASLLTARVTWYDWTGSRMTNGEWPHAGAAACSWNLPEGTVVKLQDGTVVTCEDRGGELVTWTDRSWLCWPNCTDVWVDVYGDPWAHWRNDWTQVEVWLP